MINLEASTRRLGKVARVQGRYLPLRMRDEIFTLDRTASCAARIVAFATAVSVHRPQAGLTFCVFLHLYPLFSCFSLGRLFFLTLRVSVSFLVICLFVPSTRASPRPRPIRLPFGRMAQKQQPSFLGGLALGRAQHRPTPQREKTDSSTRPPVLLQNESSDGRSPRGPSHELERPHHLSLNGIGIRFILPAVVGGVYIIVGFWAAYRPQGPPIVSHSQDHSTEAKAGFTALLGIWSVVLLAPIWSTITDVRAEEWWRRLTGNRQATLGSCNNISSNRQGYLSLIRHCIRHPFETSPSLWLVIPLVIVTTILGNFIPGSFQISPGSATRPAPVKMPSLVNNPFNVSFSQPFNNLPRVNFSNRNIAHVYLDLQQTNAAEVGIATGATNILSPKPLLEGKATGATYATDIAGLSYTCEWVAPAFGGFVPGSTATSGLPNVQVQVKDVLGLTEVPRFGNCPSLPHLLARHG